MSYWKNSTYWCLWIDQKTNKFLVRNFRLNIWHGVFWRTFLIENVDTLWFDKNFKIENNDRLCFDEILDWKWQHTLTKQGRKWIPKIGWANSNVARRGRLAAPSLLPKNGWAIAHSAHPQLTPLQNFDDIQCFDEIFRLKVMTCFDLNLLV